MLNCFTGAVLMFAFRVFLTVARRRSRERSLVVKRWWGCVSDMFMALAKANVDCGSGLLLFSVIMFCEGHSGGYVGLCYIFYFVLLLLSLLLLLLLFFNMCILLLLLLFVCLFYYFYIFF
ncbi:Phosphoribosyl-AMP cyclohydrolase [Candidatus Hodgkinia cicadicola]|nr:Phosphoribosyl-AMP cyclohydrolase [Candidatus Hodgkinia cicadicola]